ncbi:phage protein Gp13 family protein [Pseudomonas asplenii]|uniref:phage protein Gp13 family protein n=1 Tax=Pseudomonas asplenii TaxID=53407 RepID=UPI0006B55148
MYKVKATVADLRAAAGDLSPGDLAEFHCMQAGRDVVEVLTGAHDETTHAIKCGALVLAVGGHGNGGIWFVTTNLVTRLTQADRFRFYKILKDHLRSIRRGLPAGAALTNWVSVENYAHIRLLESLRAKFAEGHTMSPAGFRFRQFWL